MDAKAYYKEYYKFQIMIIKSATKLVKSIESDATEEEDEKKLFELVNLCNGYKEFICEEEKNRNF